MLPRNMLPRGPASVYAAHAGLAITLWCNGCLPRGVLVAGLAEVTGFDCDKLGRDDEALQGFMNRVGGRCA
jgi:hypothetical protein